TSSAMVLGFSTLLALVFLLAAAPISLSRRPFSSRAAQSTYAFISPPSHSINRFTRRERLRRCG
ncbi:hypothetical protein FK514_29475, partial [Klebsiella pneumoniae]|nr:hypothetical protein [Klebsiella pneumoniae]